MFVESESLYRIDEVRPIRIGPLIPCRLCLFFVDSCLYSIFFRYIQKNVWRRRQKQLNKIVFFFYGEGETHRLVLISTYLSDEIDGSRHGGRVPVLPVSTDLFRGLNGCRYTSRFLVLFISTDSFWGLDGSRCMGRLPTSPVSSHASMLSDGCEYGRLLEAIKCFFLANIIRTKKDSLDQRSYSVVSSKKKPMRGENHSNQENDI